MPRHTRRSRVNSSENADRIYPGWKEELDYISESSVQAATFDLQQRAAPPDSLDYLRKLSEQDLIKDGRRVLGACIMKPKAGYGYLATAAHLAAESSTGTNVTVGTKDDFTESVDAPVSHTLTLETRKSRLHTPQGCSTENEHTHSCSIREDEVTPSHAVLGLLSMRTCRTSVQDRCPSCSSLCTATGTGQRSAS